MVPAILAGAPESTLMDNLCPSDRSWAVAGLKRAGYSGDQTADAMGCSVRLVRTILAADMTKVCELYQSETESFRDEVRLLTSDNTAKAVKIEELCSELRRVRTSLNRLIDEKITGVRTFPKCGHPKDKVNTWTNARGHEFCRCCHAERQRRYRAGQRGAGPAAVLPDLDDQALETVTTDAVTTEAS